ncbi:MAG: hypothetical protein RIU46_38980 [Deltaproteobacteria bacterium]|jgi:hypothetical protein
MRKVFHPQLVDLWSQPPLSAQRSRLLDPNRRPENPPGGWNVLHDVAGHTFAATVNSRLETTAELEIVLLRPEAPGALLAQGGDIDNRLKTLLDALTIPRHENAVPDAFVPAEDERPFHCLLEDDALVTALSVRTHRWLNPDAARDSEVVLLVHVATSTRTKRLDNADF